ESGMRRGKKTARMIWGNQASVLVGDFLLGQAFRMMVDVGSLEALDILSSAASIIAEGEVMQLAAAKNLETTEDEHFAVIKAKATDDAGLEKAIGLMTRHGAIADTIGRARHFGEIARDALAPLEATPQKSALVDVIDFCISRVN